MHPLQLQCTLGQAFGGNQNTFYAGQGLKGHPGCDEHCGYGTDIASYVDQFIYTLYPVGAPANDGYTAIFGIVETDLEVFEWIEGHVSRIDVSIGDSVKKGQVIGAEGNHGVVYQGPELITLAMQAAGDHRGSHRHIQKRPLNKVRLTSVSKQYLRTRDRVPYRDDNGFYYEIVMPYNGYAGCVDPLAPLFPRDLFVGRTGYDVLLLQRAMCHRGYLSQENCIGTFGPKTAAAVIKYQAWYGINPMLGYCGPRTRAVLNEEFSQV